MDPASVTVSFELPQAEQVRASRVIVHRLWSTWAAYAFFALLSAWVLGDSIWRAWQGWYVSWSTTLPVASAPLAMIGVIYAVPWWTVRRWRKDIPIHQGPHAWTISEAGIRVESPHVNSTLEWALIREVRENPEFVFLCLSKRFAYIVPKRVLQGGTAESFWQAMERWAPRVVRAGAARG